METKTHIRKLIGERKKTTPTKTIKALSEKICEKVIALPAFIASSCVYVYVDFNKEIETKKIIEAAWNSGKRVAVPKVEGSTMSFYEITSFAQLKPGCWGILEPHDCQKIDWDEALMIVPGVAFDKWRHRIGYGGGFYDKYLSGHPNCVTVAIAFDFQIVAEVPTEIFDIVPQMLITETQTY